MTLAHQNGKRSDPRFSFPLSGGKCPETALRDTETPLEYTPKVNSPSTDVEKEREASGEGSTICPEKAGVRGAGHGPPPGEQCGIPVQTARGSAWPRFQWADGDTAQTAKAQPWEGSGNGGTKKQESWRHEATGTQADGVAPRAARVTDRVRRWRQTET